MDNSFNLLDAVMQLYDKSNEIIFFLDNEGNILHRNKTSYKIIENNVSAHLESALCVHCQGLTTEDALITCEGCYLHEHIHDKLDFQLFMKIKDGSTQPFSANYETISDDPVIRVLRLNNVSDQMRTQEVLHQKTVTKKILEAQEEERKRISRELHDSVIQSALSILMDVRLFKYLKGDELNNQVSQSEIMLNQLIKSLRNISVELRPSALDDLGLTPALRSHFKYIEKNYGMEINFISHVDHLRFDSEIETALYRIIQEAVYNAVKYANVDFLNVSIIKDKQLNIWIKDDGDGFELKDEPHGSGLGLFGMNERAEAIGAQLTIKSVVGTGTEILVTLPIDGEKTYENSYCG